MKILYVTTISNTTNAFLIPHIRMLIEDGNEVDVAFNIDRQVSPELLKLGCRVYEIPFQRSPICKDNIKSYRMLKDVILKRNYDIVHTHTPVASAITRLVCKSIKKSKVYYTAHGFHFYKGASLKNWLLYYPVEKWLSKYTDTLITINNEDFTRAKNKFNARKVKYVPGVGLDVEKLRNVVVDRSSKRAQLCIPEDAFLLLSVGELNNNKNHEVVIRTLAKLNNPQIHYIVCGKGPCETYLNKLSKELGVEKKVHLLGFRRDIPEICKISDLFVFPSLREGLPVSMMEAMACGLPIICTSIRGNLDLIIDQKGGLLFEPNNFEELSKCINEIFENKLLRTSMGNFNKDRIECYSLSAVLDNLKSIYY